MWSTGRSWAGTGRAGRLLQGTRRSFPESATFFGSRYPNNQKTSKVRMGSFYFRLFMYALGSDGKDSASRAPTLIPAGLRYNDRVSGFDHEVFRIRLTLDKIVIWHDKTDFPPSPVPIRDMSHYLKFVS